MRRRLAAILALALLPASLSADASSIDRLTRVAKLWGTVRYLHPWLAYKDIDWDAALVATLPRLRQAKTKDEYRAAVQGLLATLGDPVTGVTEPPPPLPPVSPEASAELARELPGGVLAIDLATYARTAAPKEAFAAIGELPARIAKASGVLVDLRGARAGLDDDPWAWYYLDQIGQALVGRSSRAPAQRFLVHSGYAPQDGTSSGGYYTGFVTESARVFDPRPGVGDHKVVFLVDRWGWLPPLIMALQASGTAHIACEGAIGDESIVQSRRVDLGEGLEARVRTSELVPLPGWSGARVDLELPEGSGEKGLELAAADVVRDWPAVISKSSAAPVPDPLFRPEKAYAEMKEPDLDYRQLAVIRAWNVIHWFYPYLHLIGDWDSVLPESLARMESASSARDYSLALIEMMTHVADGHTSLWGRPEIEQPFGDAYLPVRARWVEGAPVVFRASEKARQAGVELGDAILAVDGETVEARDERFGRYFTASTRPALLDLLAGVLLVGPAGSSAVVKVQKLDGSIREVKLVRDPKDPVPKLDRGDVVRVLPGNLGYVDLVRLTTAEVDGMFEKLASTRGIVFDMRGYPQGTAWPIAPRINTRRAKVGAQFRRALVEAHSEEESDAGFYFSQPLPELPAGKAVYNGPTVMLIDDRAISQSEHSALFFEAASGTTFVGTATAGANGDVTSFPVPGGIWIGFTGHDVRHADGRQLQRIGIVPDVEAAPTRAGIHAGRDEVLEKGIETLERLLAH